MSYLGSALRVTCIESKVHDRHYRLNTFPLLQRRTVDPQEQSKMNIVVKKHVGFESVPIPFQISVTHGVGNRKSVLIVTDLK
jgi:hypothetical protein